MEIIWFGQSVEIIHHNHELVEARMMLGRDPVEFRAEGPSFVLALSSLEANIRKLASESDRSMKQLNAREWVEKRDA